MPQFSRQSVPGEHAEPRESTRVVRVREKVQQFNAVRLLVVYEQSFDRGGDHTGAHRTAGNQLHPATLRRASAGTTDLQVEKHACHSTTDPDEFVPAAAPRRRRGDAASHRTGREPAIPGKLRAVDGSSILSEGG